MCLFATRWQDLSLISQSQRGMCLWGRAVAESSNCSVGSGRNQSECLPWGLHTSPTTVTLAEAKFRLCKACPSSAPKPLWSGSVGGSRCLPPWQSESPTEWCPKALSSSSSLCPLLLHCLPHLQALAAGHLGATPKIPVQWWAPEAKPRQLTNGGVEGWSN